MMISREIEVNNSLNSLNIRSKIWRQSVRKYVTLTHSFPMHFFCTPGKYQKTVRLEKGCIGNEWVKSPVL